MTGLIVFGVTVASVWPGSGPNVDFASTIAVGSTMATVIIGPARPLVSGFAALGVLFLLPWGHDTLCRWSDRWRTTVDAEPALLVREGKVLEADLARDGAGVGDT